MVFPGKVIDCLLYFKGSFKRSDLCEILSISPASATREIKKYRDEYKCNIQYDVSAKRYSAANNFSPAYKYSNSFALNLLFNRKLVINLQPDDNDLDIGLPEQFPSQDIVAQLSRACIEKQSLRVTYLAAEANKEPFRTIIPTRMFFIGGSWYVRVYSKKHNEKAAFRSLKLVRFSSVSTSTDALNLIEDQEWLSQVTLTLAPHSKHEEPDSLRLDLGLQNKPVVNINTNEALAGFILQASNVDCSVDASLSPKSYQYQLMNRHELLNVGSMVITPGFNVVAS